MITHLANSILSVIRHIEIGEGATFPDDPDASDPNVVIPEMDCWRTSGATNKVLVFVAAFDADNKRVMGVTADVSAFFRTPATAFGGGAAIAPEVWHDAGTYAGFILDEPFVLNVATHNKMGVCLSNIAMIGDAVLLSISVQEMPS